MINHPNRGRIHPDSTIADRCREAGARVRLVWEERGPKNTGVAFLTCYLINDTLCIVSTFSRGGWDAYTPCGEVLIENAVADVMRRCGVQS